MKRALMITTVLMSFAVANAFGADEQWLTDFSAASKAAAARKVPLLVAFTGSDWCGWCLKLDREVFQQKEFKDFAGASVVLFVADFPQDKKLPAPVVEQNAALADKYGLKGFPTVLLLDATGKILARTGYRSGGAAAYVTHLRGLMKGDAK